MSTPVKRKRGRPRRDDSREISQFDLTLIQEYRKRTQFYDPNHPNYKNRPELEVEWVDMARCMGNSVQLVKNRMIQLRNRYNLEKRRVEMLQHQYQDPTITSQWPLFDKLSFLGSHIKTRRTFSNVLAVHPKNQPPSSTSSGSDEEVELSHSLPNGLGLELPESITPVHPMVTRQHVLSFSNDNDNEDTPPPPNPSEIKATKKRRTHETLLPNSNSAISKAHAGSAVTSNRVAQCDGGGGSCIAGGGGGPGVEKFKAFGQFLASSLMEINEKDALRLIEKFTSDLVHSLLAEVKSPCNDVDSVQTRNTSNMDLSI